MTRIKSKPFARKVEIREHGNKKRFPKGIKKIMGSRQLIDDSLEFGINDFEYMLVQKILKDPYLNATRAYSELYPVSSTDYAMRAATKTMCKEPVRNYFNHCLNERLKIGVVTEKEILYNLKLVALRCMQGQEIVDKDGKRTGEWKFEPNAANKAWELLGKNLGIFTEKVELSGSVNIPVRAIPAEMSIKEATQLYAANLKREVKNDGIDNS